VGKRGGRRRVAVSGGCAIARDVILLGEIAARSATMLEIRCGRCDRHGRLSVARLLAEHGPGADFGAVMRKLVGDCPNKDSAQIQNRCDPYCPDLPRLFLTRPDATSSSGLGFRASTRRDIFAASAAALCLRSISFGDSAWIMVGRFGCSMQTFLRLVRFSGSA
jgi:hypothetical protein